MNNTQQNQDDVNVKQAQQEATTPAISAPGSKEPTHPSQKADNFGADYTIARRSQKYGFGA